MRRGSKPAPAGTRLVQQFGRLTGNIDVAAAVRLGVPVANLTRLSTLSCADHVTALILAHGAQLLPAHRSVVARHDAALTAQLSRKTRRATSSIGPAFATFRVLAQSTVGFIGLGEISGLVAPRLRAMGARVLYYKRTRLSAEEDAAMAGSAYAPLDDLLAQSDFVTLQVPYSAATEKFADRDILCER